MAKTRPKAGRTLLVFVIVVGVLYALVAVAGSWTPRLGLDLEGGTRIQLVAQGNPSSAKMAQAVSIIQQRANGSGVSEAQVSTQGSNDIVVQIPGHNNQNLVDVVQRTAQLRFRLLAYCDQLLKGQPCETGPTPPKSNSQSGSSTKSGTKTKSKNSESGASGSKAKSSSTSNKGSKTAKGSKGSNPRPAPAYLTYGKKKPAAKPSASTTAKPTGNASTKPGTSPTAPTAPSPAVSTTKGANPQDYLAWTKNPGTDWQLLFGVAQCDKKSHQARVPAIANTMSLTSPPSPKALENQLKHSKMSSYVPMHDLPNRPLISCDARGNKYLFSVAPINGTDVSGAQATTDQQQSLGQWVVSLKLKNGGPDAMAKISEALVPGSSVDGGKYANGKFGIVLDGQTLEVPGFNGTIPNGTAQITGGFTQKSATSLANSLRYGALPVKFKKDTSVQYVGPTLAGNQLSAGLLAGLVGLLIVMAYCLLYYRGLGTVVIASLIVAAVVTYAVVLLLAKTAGFTLTLPGIAGLIVAVGITADSFIVYFERIRDEMRSGKSMRVAAQAGWIRARNTCLAADGVSFLAALVLYIFAIDVVKGFAFALGISTIIDVLVFFFFTHPMITLLSYRRFFNQGAPMSGLSRAALGVEDADVVGGRL